MQRFTSEYKTCSTFRLSLQQHLPRNLMTQKWVGIRQRKENNKDEKAKATISHPWEEKTRKRRITNRVIREENLGTKKKHTKSLSKRSVRVSIITSEPEDVTPPLPCIILHTTYFIFFFCPFLLFEERRNNMLRNVLNLCFGLKKKKIIIKKKKSFLLLLFTLFFFSGVMRNKKGKFKYSKRERERCWGIFRK